MSSWGTGEATAVVPVGPRGLPGPPGVDGAPGVAPPLATTEATVTGTDSTLPAHSAGVAAAITDRAVSIVPTVAALAASSPHAGADFVHAMGYAVAGDGGGGLLSAHASQQAATDIQSPDGRWWTPMPMAGALSAHAYGALPSRTAAQNGAALQAAIDAGALAGARVVLTIRGSYEIAEVSTKQFADIECGPGVLLTFDHSTSGAIVSNADDDSDWTMSSVRLSGLAGDGADYLTPVTFNVVSATTTTIELPSGASAVDDFYNGLIIQIMSGAAVAQYKFIADYVGSTRVATLESALSVAPSGGDSVSIGFNDNFCAFARGATKFTLSNISASNLASSKQVPGGQGGKALNLEQGASGFEVRGVRASNCATAVFVSGRAGEVAPGVSASAVQNLIEGVFADNCGSLLTVANLDGVAGISTSPAELGVTVRNLRYKNCGHSPHRVVGTNPQKSGVINLAGANGADISDVAGYNEATYPDPSPGYPTDFAARCGYGLSGNVGALIWGHAARTRVSNVRHNGNLDRVVHIGRGRAIGDDASPGTVSGCVDWNMDNVIVEGTVGVVVGDDPILRIGANAVSGRWQIGVSDATALIAAGMAAQDDLILDISKIGTRYQVVGRPADILARGNTFPDYPEETVDLTRQDVRVFTLADDTAVSFTPLRTTGRIEFRSETSLLIGAFSYRATASPQCTILSAGVANWAVSTVELTGTTGTDGFMTFSATSDGRIHLENRRGGQVKIIMNIDLFNLP